MALDSSNFAGKSFLLNENKRKGLYSDAIELNKIQMDSDPCKAETLLEFFILCVGKHMNLSSKQVIFSHKISFILICEKAASLFTKNSKYLAHIIIKGLKGQFEPIITFLQEVYTNLDHVLTLLDADLSRSTLSFSLQVLLLSFKI